MWEYNRRLPDAQRLRELADFFNVTVDYLLDIESITSTEEQEIKNIIETLEQLAQQLRTIFIEK